MGPGMTCLLMDSQLWCGAPFFGSHRVWPELLFLSEALQKMGVQAGVISEPLKSLKVSFFQFFFGSLFLF